MQQIFSHKNNHIVYTDIGLGNIVVLLHGFGEDESIWKHQVEFLQKKYRVIIPNLPGSGKSNLLEKQNVTIEDYAICIHQLMESILHNSNEKITLLGHSMGGYITLAYAKLFPQKLNAFGLIHSTAFADSEEKKQVRLRGIEMMKEYGAYFFLKNTIPNLFSNSFKQNHSQQVEKLIESSETLTIAALQQYYIAMINREDTTDVLKNATFPVLFVIGTEDIAAPINDMLQQCHFPQQSYIHILENVGHIGMLEMPNEVNIFIDKFLQEIN